MRRRAAVALLVVGLLAALDLVRPLPRSWLEPREHRRVVDRAGQLLAERPVPDRGHELWVELDEVAPAVVDALLAAEDDRFYLHPGVDPVALARALWIDVRAGEVVQGGSTLTQQTARLLAGRPAGLPGKALEAWRALKLELHLGKREILTWYLNRAYFGGGAYGIEAAARRTFDESAATLSVSEAAALIATLPAPGRRSPNPRTRDEVLDRMVATGRLSETEAALAKAEPLELRSRRPDGLAPHLVTRALDEGAPVVALTLDGMLQRDVEALVTERIAALDSRDVDHAAVIVAHVPTSEVRAWVGSADFAAPDGQVDGARARRSPGSALKPFVYGLAFEAGYRPSDVVPDVPRRYGTSHGSWAPENYDRSFRGPVRLREALAGSYNVPAVVLLDEIGVSTVQSRLVGIGFDLPRTASHYGLGLTLGDAGVTLEELTAAYAGLARGGVWAPLRTRLDDPAGDGIRFLAPESAWLVTDVLADPVARVPSFGRRTPLARPYAASVKTGTSTGYRDNWTVGYTPEWAVGVWVGNFDGRPMGDVSGVTGAGPLWAAVMDRVTRGRSVRPEPPDTLERVTTCALSGLAPGPHCPHTVDDWAPRGAEARPTCSWHPGACGVAWPPELLPWAADHDLADAGCEGSGEPGIAWPADGTVLYVDPRIPSEHQRVPLRAEAPAGARVAEWYAGGTLIARSDPAAPALWQPSATGEFELALVVDGRAAGTVRIEVRGAP